MERRILEHKSGKGSVFTGKYNLHYLLYYEEITGMRAAIDREKQLKKWHKEWKWNLIRSFNPALIDMAGDWYSKEEIMDYKKWKNGSHER